jgi:hypothetical protein
MKEGRLTRRLKVRGDRDIRAPTVNDRRKKRKGGTVGPTGEVSWAGGPAYASAGRERPAALLASGLEGRKIKTEGGPAGPKEKRGEGRGV